MLPKPHRLRRSADLQRLWQHGQSRRHPLAILMIGVNDLNRSRFAFAASRRVGKAVARNRAKRVLREAVRRHLAEIAGGWDCLFVARRETSMARYDEVEEAVLHLLRSSKLHGDGDQITPLAAGLTVAQENEIK